MELIRRALPRLCRAKLCDFVFAARMVVDYPALPQLTDPEVLAQLTAQRSKEPVQIRSAPRRDSAVAISGRPSTSLLGPIRKTNVRAEEDIDVSWDECESHCTGWRPSAYSLARPVPAEWTSEHPMTAGEPLSPSPVAPELNAALIHAWPVLRAPQALTRLPELPLAPSGAGPRTNMRCRRGTDDTRSCGPSIGAASSPFYRCPQQLPATPSVSVLRTIAKVTLATPATPRQVLAPDRFESGESRSTASHA